ncbi:hypothetical protein CY34DRAFT_804431 [Suillus luteus UH-Slu-Lm8-n1]|uniref:Uncharacterized protein n=1 Tax=Suillus luteus UH-Slu-Lm8-n1 TaxID=930992 RepID=A0A0D0ALX0_9AGAM|nr:hypothetical protein CY34DRAFT_804431 [Suillus luteus UH-Slu-Lm8-n1]
MTYYKPISYISASGGNASSVGVLQYSDKNRVSVIPVLNSALNDHRSGYEILANINVCSAASTRAPLL